MAALAAYLMFARTRGINSSFLLLRDQIRDWGFALGPFADLPLTGTQSTAGGSSLGPIYYWVLWACRVVIGPWTNNLPTAGAIGISLLQTGADLLLLEALRRALGSFWLAFALILLLATTSHDLAISATIWNPAVSVAFVKVALSLLLLSDRHSSIWWVMATTVSAWFAVQAHSVAIFVAGPVLGVFLVRDLSARDVAAAWRKTRAIGETIVVLQLPFLYHAWSRSGADAGPTRALGGLSEAVRNPETLRLGASLDALVGFTGHIFTTPWPAVGWRVILACAVLGTLWRARRDLALLAASVAPLACAVAGLSLWTGNYDEYWYLPLAPCAAITVGAALSLWRRDHIAIALLILGLAVQPSRLTYAQMIYRMPEYGALARGARAIKRQTPVVRGITTTFPLPPFANASFLYESLGGQLRDDAAFDAVIDDSGAVRFVPLVR